MNATFHLARREKLVHKLTKLWETWEGNPNPANSFTNVYIGKKRYNFKKK